MALTRFVLASCLLAAGLLTGCALAPTVAAGATTDDGQRAFAAGRYREARAIWSVRARAGDPDAMLGLGLVYDLGRGAKQDQRAALSWYEQAGALGSPQGALNAAVMLDAGRGTGRDPEAAALWYARAATLGDHRAQYDLGQLYASGDGVPLNLPLAAAWFAAAKQGGLEAAAGQLASLRQRAKAAKLAGRAEPSRPIPIAPISGSEVKLPPSASPAAPAEAAAEAAAGAAAGAAASVADGAHTVPLVWTERTQAEATRFFVEVVALHGGKTAPVFSGYTGVSAVPVAIATPGRYAWRVFAVDTARRAYVATPWQRFTLAPAVTQPAVPHTGPQTAPPPGAQSELPAPVAPGPSQDGAPAASSAALRALRASEG